MIQNNKVKTILQYSTLFIVNSYKVSDFKDVHTRNLLKLLRKINKTLSCIGREYINSFITEQEWIIEKSPVQHWHDEIKKILSTREHIPNKAEAKLKRQLAAKKRNERYELLYRQHSY